MRTTRRPFTPLLTRLEDRTTPAPTLTVGQAVNATRLASNQAEISTAINPTNTQNIVVFSNNEGGGGTPTLAVSFDGGATFATREVGNGDGVGSNVCCDAQAAFDQFGNL